jgi:hypothetical protein
VLVNEAAFIASSAFFDGVRCIHCLIRMTRPIHVHRQINKDKGVTSVCFPLRVSSQEAVKNVWVRSSWLRPPCYSLVHCYEFTEQSPPSYTHFFDSVNCFSVCLASKHQNQQDRSTSSDLPSTYMNINNSSSGLLVQAIH